MKTSDFITRKVPAHYIQVTSTVCLALLLAGCGQPQQQQATGDGPPGEAEPKATQAESAPQATQEESQAQESAPPEQAAQQTQPEEAAPSSQEDSQPSAEQQAAAPPAFGQASIAGTITLEGDPPTEKTLPLDPACGRLHDETPTTTFYITGANNGLADVFVHVVSGLPEQDYTPPSEPHVIDQEGCLYTPYVSGAMTGQTIKVLNSDPVLHNVHPTPTVPGNKEYNKAQLPNGAPLEFSWSNPEVLLRFKCDVHPWMFSYVGLVDHPYYDTTDESGKFSIANLPPGTYTIEALHRKAGKVTKDVTVEEGKPATLDITLAVGTAGAE